MKKLLPFLVICFYSQVAFGQTEPATQPERTELDADRPSKGDASKIVPKGYYQLEAGIQFENDETNFSSDKVWHLPELTFRAGVFDFAELRFRAQFTHQVLDINSATPVENRFTNSGLDEVMIGTKIQLLQNNGIVPELALQADFKLPVGSDDLQNDKFEPKLRLNFKNKLSEALSLQYNLGVEWEEDLNLADDKEYSHVGIYTMALAYKITPDFVVYGEAAGEFEKKDMRQSLNTGLAYKIASNIQLDAYTGFGLSEEAPDLFISGGVTFRFPK